ncbi:LIC_10190 family membrane protein [Azospirillum sp. sgz302134]
MVFVVVVSCVLALSFIGYGLFARRLLFRDASPGSLTVGDLGLLGMAVMMIIAGSLHFLAPLKYVAYLTIPVGMLAFPALWRDLRHLVPGGNPLWAWVPPLLVVPPFVVMGAWSVYNGASHYDTGLYHLQTILQLQDDPFVVGLANIHHRFGYNSMWFPLAAASGLPLMEVAGAFACNVVAYGLVIAALAQRIPAAFLDGRLSGALFGGGVVWVLLETVMANRLSGTPNTDLPTTLLVLYVFALGVESLKNTPAADPKADTVGDVRLGLATVFAAMAISVKLSQMMVGLVPLLLLFAFPGWWGRLRRLLAGPALLAGAIFVVMLVRGVLTSSCLAFPSGASCLPGIPWAVGTDIAANDWLWMRSWARLPGVTPDKVLGSWDWLNDWVPKLLQDPVMVDLADVYLAAAAAAPVTALLWWLGRTGRLPASANQTWRIRAGLLVTVTLGLLFWFATAPLLRYGEGFLVALPFLLLSLLAPFDFVLLVGKRVIDRLAAIPLPAIALPKLRLPNLPLPAIRLPDAQSVRLRWLAPLVTAAGAYLLFLPAQDLADRISEEQVYTREWPKIPAVELADWQNGQGITFHSPVTGDQCWGAPRPCTPSRNPGLVIDRWMWWTMVLRQQP